MVALLLLALVLGGMTPAPARPATRPKPPKPEIRAVWVDGFNAGIRTPEECDKLVADAKAAHLNTLIVQVRRRGDSFYAKSLEPPVEDAPYTPDFDALGYLIERAHGAGLEVHAWMNAMTIWRRNFPAPSDPKHVFNAHGLSATGAEAWLTRNREGSAEFPGSYFLDPGNPDAAAHVAAVVRNLVKNYPVDGVHLDYIRYPETNSATADTGGPVGYNETSLERFRKRYKLETGMMPANNDPRWSAWRREQVTNLVRRIYLETTEINPRCKVSAAAITWGDGPKKAADWPRSNAYGRVYQDWQSWLKEGILDLAVPMNYFRQADARGRGYYQRWLAFESSNKQGRQLAVGMGVYLNSADDNLKQARLALTPLRKNSRRSVDGLSFFSYQSMLKTLADRTPAIYPNSAPVPPMKWKEHPERGGLCGIAPAADGGRVTLIQNRKLGKTTRILAADGNGFFGAANIPPGTYRIKIAELNFDSGPIKVEAGRVTRVEVTAPALR